MVFLKLDAATSQMCAHLKSLGVDAQPAPYLHERYNRKLHEIKLSEFEEFASAKRGNLRYVELKNSSIDAIRFFIEVDGILRRARGRVAYIVDAHAIGIREPQSKSGKRWWVGLIGKFFSISIGIMFLTVSILLLLLLLFPEPDAPPQAQLVLIGVLLIAGIILIGWPTYAFLLKWYRQKDWRSTTKHFDVKTKKIKKGVFARPEGFRWIGSPLAKTLNQDISLTEQLYHEEGNYGHVKIDLSGPCININSPPGPWINIHSPLPPVIRLPSMEAFKVYDRIGKHIHDYAKAIQ